jgi:enoyl-CoA hydratase/carnithine racemase
MTLAMDIRLAADDARMGFVFSRRGIVPEAASSWFLPRIVGIAQALQWTYSGKVFPATEALEKGLVSSLHPRDALLPAAYAIAAELRDNTSQVSLALIRQMMWKMLGADHPMAAHRLDSRGVFETGKGADAKEGVSSFVEKRQAVFPNRVPRDLPSFLPWWEKRTFE